MRAGRLALALVALGTGCQIAPPAAPLPAGDPRPRALLEAWRAHAAGRGALHAVARLAVEAKGAGVGGADLSLRSKQRLWLARPASLRVEVLGFLDTTLAVLTTDGQGYAWFQTEDRSFDSGPVYEGLLWDAARLDLTPSEAVEVILGIPDPAADLRAGAAYAEGERVVVELGDAAGRVLRVVEFGAGGELRRLEQRKPDGGLAWEARFDDYALIRGTPFARNVGLRSGSDQTSAELRLTGVQLNPEFTPELFRLHAPTDSRRGGSRTAPTGLRASASEGG